MEFDKVIAPTDEIKKILKENGFKGVEVLPSGMDLEKFKVNRIKDLRKKFKIPKNAFVFIYFGRVSFEKRLDVLMKAFKMIEDDRTYLVIAGTGPFLKKFEEMGREIGIKNIRFTGFVPDEDLVSCYRMGDVFVSASDTETQGLVFVEAMACGLPVIGSDVGGSKDMIKDGKIGFLFKAGDENDLAEKMKKIMDDRTREKFIKNIPKYVKEFDSSRIAEKFLRICKEVMRK
jgi:1,2-diacylglycerol 3-alpha-glucosyltransferase